MKSPDRILSVPQWVGCLACLLILIPWLVGVYKLLDWTFQWVMQGGK